MMRPIVLPSAALFLSVAWLGWEIGLREIKPALHDETGQQQELAARDPRPGSSLEIPGVPRQGRVALVWTGSCNQCSAHGFTEEQLKAAIPPGTQVFLLLPYPPDEDYYPSFQKIVLTLEQRAALNTYFSPRAYIYQDGKLSAFQADGTKLFDFIGGQK